MKLKPIHWIIIIVVVLVIFIMMFLTGILVYKFLAHPPINRQALM